MNNVEDTMKLHLKRNTGTHCLCKPSRQYGLSKHPSAFRCQSWLSSELEFSTLIGV